MNSFGKFATLVDMKGTHLNKYGSRFDICLVVRDCSNKLLLTCLEFDTKVRSNNGHASETNLHTVQPVSLTSDLNILRAL